MAKGIEARISVLERTVGRLGISLGKVTDTLYGGKDAAPKKARKPRQPRQALGTVSAAKETQANVDFGMGTTPAGARVAVDDGKKRRGRKKAEAPQAVDAGGEGYGDGV